MPRQRTIPDEALLDEALLVVRAAGPDALTFAALAARVDLAASTIVQRFGTKAALLHAALSRAWDHLEEETSAAIDACVMEPLGAIEMLVRLSGQYDPDDFADQLLILREDLRDPVLRTRGQRWLATLTRAIEDRLGLPPEATAGLGDLVVTQWQGTLTVWSFRRDAPLVDAVRTGLEDLFDRLGLGPPR